MEKDEKRSELAFKDFSCPPEGGEIFSHTTDGRTAKGKIQSNRKLVFTLEGANCDKLYFEGQMAKDKNSITGTYGVEENEMEWSYKMLKKEVQVIEMWQGFYIEDEKEI